MPASTSSGLVETQAAASDASQSDEGIVNAAAPPSPDSAVSSISSVSSASSLDLSSVPPRAARYVLRRAQKRYLLAKLPPVLVIHLKRFQQTSKMSLFKGSFTDLKKLDEYVSFPERLDLSPFMAPPEKEADGRTKRGLHSADGEKTHEYRLYAVTVHLGGMEGGHYVAYVREEGGDSGSGSGGWTYCSDEKTRPATWEEVRVSKAYMLWYART
jgi:ubiquitin carboxyl-terminal hydrolase 16/45